MRRGQVTCGGGASGRGRGLRLPGWQRRRRRGTLEHGSRGVSPITSAGSIRGHGREDRELCIAHRVSPAAPGVVLTEHVAAAELDESGEEGGACGAGGREGAAGSPLCREELRRGARDRVRPTWAPTPEFSYSLDLWVFRGGLLGRLPASVGAGWEEAALASSLPPSTELSFDIGGISPA